MAEARAHTNIAVVKYWGKHPRWEEYHVPTKSSLSFTVKDLYTTTEVSAVPGSGKVRKLIFNGKELGSESKEFKRIQGYLEKLTRFVHKDFSAYDYVIETENNFPTAAGLASSASGFAALTKALLLELSSEHSWAEEILSDERKLSAVARLGSGSASRSVANGVVLWRRGWDSKNFDPMWNSYAESVGSAPENVALVYIFLKKKRKKISSGEGMKISRDTSPFYWFWVENEEKDIEKDVGLATSKKLKEKFFERVIVHSNSFHAVCRSSYPPIEYLTDRSREIMERIHRFNNEYGSVVAYTFDAGPNPVLFVIKDVLDDVKRSVLDGHEFLITEVI